MANRFWVGGTGNWDATTTHWSLTSGGAAGAAVPTATDDVYFDANSGGGIVTVNTATRLCLSLSFRGTSGTSDFTGSFASSGTGTNTISGGLILSPSATYSGYTATMTFNGAAAFNITSNGKALSANFTFSNASGNWTFTDSFTTGITNTVTLTAGTLTEATNSFSIYWGLFSSSGTGVRNLNISDLVLTGNGTIWNSSTATSLTVSSNITLTDATANTKTFTTSTVTAAFIYGNIYIEGAGTGAYVFTGNFTNASFDVNYTGGASITITGTLYYLSFSGPSTGSLIIGTASSLTSYLSFVNCSSNFAWNTPTANTLNVNSSAYIVLDSLMTITSMPTITFTGAGGFIHSKGRTWLSPITVNATGGSLYIIDTTSTFKSLSTFTITAGDVKIDNGITNVGYLQVTNLSVTGTAVRSLQCTEVILTGSGTLLTATTATNLNFNTSIIRVAGTTTLARTLTFTSLVYTIYIYFEGTGTGGLTFTPGTVAAPFVYVTNTGGASFSISTGAIDSIDFTGSNVNWNNAAAQTVTLYGYGNITLSPTMTTTLTPAIVLNGPYGPFYGNPTIRSNGKSFVTGTITINDLGGSTYVFADAFSSNAGVTITVGTVNINANFTLTGSSTTLTLTSGDLNVKNGANITCGIVSCLNAGVRTINMGSGTWNLTGVGVVWNFASATNTTLNAQQSRILINDTSNTTITFASGNNSSFTYYTVEFARGASTGTIAITSGAGTSPVITSTFANFINNTSTAAHTMSFTSGATLAFYKFNVKGFSTSARISLNRSTSAATNFVKVGQGIVSNADNLIIGAGQQICTPGLTWYAGAGSTGAPNSWLAGNAPSSQSLLGSGGVG